MMLEKCVRRWGRPGWQVDPVRDVVDGYRTKRAIRVVVMPLSPCYLAVESGYAVAMAREVEPQHRHRERLTRVVGINTTIGQ